jgi:hypothetical protein
LNAAVCALSLSLGVAGCNDEKGADAPKTGDQKAQAKAGDKAAAVQAPEFLKLIPSDTPYVFANFEAVPKPVLDKMFKAMEPMIAEAEKAIAKEIETNQGDNPEAKMVRAVLEELKGNLSVAGLEKLGLGTDVRFALYGVGVMPVFRLQVKDGAALKALIARVEEKGGQKAPTKKLGDVEYWGIQEDGMTGAVAIIGNELVGALAPDAAADKVLAMAFGQTKPEKSLADTGALQDVLKKYGFQPYGVGMIDAKIVADTLLGASSGLNAEVFASVQAAMPPLSADCKGEIQGMVAKAPRMVFGYDKFTADEIAATYVVELDGGLAKELAGLRAPVPGLSGLPEGKPLMAFGVGLDIAKTIEFAKGKAKAIAAAPYKCELLQDLNQSATMAAQQLESAPIPPFVTGVKGAYVVVKDADLSAGMGPQALGSVKAYGVLSADKPDELVTMLKGMVPPLAALDLKPDGAAIALPPGLVPVPSAHAAMNDKTVGIAIGDGMQGELPAFLTAKAGEDPPLFAFSYDVGRIMKSINDQMAKSMAQLPPEMQADMQASQAMSNAMAGMLGLTSYAVHLNDKGIVLKQNIKLP